MDAVTTRLPSGLNAALSTRSLMAFQDGDLCSRLGVPQTRRLVRGRGHHAPAIGAERRAPHPPLWPFKTAISVPVSASHRRAVLSDDAVTTRLPSGLNAALHPSFMAFQDGDLCSRLGVPQTRRVVPRPRAWFCRPSPHSPSGVFAAPLLAPRMYRRPGGEPRERYVLRTAFT